jgi:all-beta uncharacterized protein
MQRCFALLAATAASVALVISSIAVDRTATTRARPTPSNGPHRAQKRAAIPLMFEPARSPARRFEARGRGYHVAIGSDGATMRLHDTHVTRTVALGFVGANRADVRAERPLAARVNYLVGQRETWRTGVTTYDRVRLRNLYPGIDAVFYGRDGNVEYDIVVAPGASPDQVRLAFPGSDSVKSSGHDLQIAVGGRSLTQHAPYAYQDIDGNRVTVSARYVVNARGEVSFAVGAYDRTHALVLDPVLAYSTYFGSTGFDDPKAIVTDAASKLYVTGFAEQGDFSVAPISPHNPAGGEYDVYAAKFNQDGTLQWLTFIGGSGSDLAYSADVAPDNDLVIGGMTQSTDFPTTAGAYHPGTPSYPNEDGFVLKLSSDGTIIRWSTCLGSLQSVNDPGPRGLRVDSVGRIVAVGETGSASFPVTIAESRGSSLPGGDNRDGYVMRFASDGSRLDFSRLLAGSKWDRAVALTLDQYNAIYVAGSTTSSDFPVLNALYPTKFGPGDQNGANGHDGFLTYLWNDGSMVFSTYLGGYGEDDMTAVVQGQYERVYVGGTTTSDGLATYTAKPSSTTQFSGIIFQIVPNGSALVNSRYIAAPGYTQITSMAVGRDLSIWVAGNNDGAGWFFTGYPDPPYQTQPGGGLDIFIQKWGPRLDELDYSALLGGSIDETATAIAADPLIGDVYFAGESSSENFPLLNAVQPFKRGAGTTSDGVVGRLACDIIEVDPVPPQPAAGGTGETLSWAEPGCLVAGASDAPWLHVTGTNGDRVTFAVDPNPNNAQRTGHITITGRTVVPVTQDASTGSGGTGGTGGTASAVDEIVLNASDARMVSGRWQVVPDSLHGSVLAEPDQGDAKITPALATPVNYFEFTFNADANKPYHLWIHGLAQNDSYLNDSAWLQFNDSIDGSGQPIWRIGTTDGSFVSLEPCSGCGEQGWGWRDNQYGGGLGPNVVFANSGAHVMRIQQREDGFTIGQVTLSAVKYLTTAPGADRNDTTVLQQAAPAPIDEVVLWPGSASNMVGAGDWSPVNDSTAAGNLRMWQPDQGVPKITTPSADPANYFEITFNADAGKAYHLWMRLKADNDSYQNDSVWVQFNGSVDSAGNPVYRIGSTSGTFVSLEECSGCGEQAWGWQDNAYGSPGDLGPDIYFAQSGPQSIRIQQREDGVSIDQIVLSAVKYKTAAPGVNKNDTTIVPRTQ